MFSCHDLRENAIGRLLFYTPLQFRIGNAPDSHIAAVEAAHNIYIRTACK
jgi:hypothetical protein